jgi:4-diphosphocytidyl-2-C-methyl-D-erythritol kinase
VSLPGRRVTPVVRIAPAKVNLTLAVTGRRPDGFHDLHSIMVPLDLADRLALSPAFGPDDRLHVVGPAGQGAPDLGPPAANLALRAIVVARRALLAAGEDGPFPALAVRLEKHIPAAAGLAGGSSDGAAALEAALEAWGVEDRLSPAAKHAAAAALGSDCPFFLAGGWALVEGRGERVTPLPAPRGAPPAILLVTPAVPVSTPAAFARHAAGIRPPGGAALASSAHLAAELRSGLPVGRFLERAGILAVANDLVPAAADLVPALVPLRRGLGRLLGRPIGQSGSGPTLWALYGSRAEADAAAAAVRDALARGDVAAPGDRSPLVTAATIMGDPEERVGEDAAPTPPAGEDAAPAPPAGAAGLSS